jgi:IS1 family transposase
MTVVDRASRCFLSWRVVTTRDQWTAQDMVCEAPAQHYFSDQYHIYLELHYPQAGHDARADKAETYSVEGGNAELRHYLARLVRRSRCFSRCLEALRAHVKLFVHAWNKRQLYRRQHPSYPAHLIDFV